MKKNDEILIRDMHVYQKTNRRCKSKASSISHRLKLNYWQIYFEIYDFFISVICKMKWRANVQIINVIIVIIIIIIIIMTDKIQICKMIA